MFTEIYIFYIPELLKIRLGGLPKWHSQHAAQWHAQLLHHPQAEYLFTKTVGKMGSTDCFFLGDHFR
jgi:hypothetical protein